jgi:hypothetical protein
MVSYPKAMTIGIGLLARDGLILGADTLVSDGASKSYRMKIHIIPPMPDRVVVVIESGGTNCAKFIESVKIGIDTIPGDSDIHRVTGFVKKCAKDLYGRIDGKNYREHFYALVGIWLRAEGRARMFMVYGADEFSFHEVQDFLCIGAGLNVGQYLLSKAYRYVDDIAAACMLSIGAVKACEDHVDGCGGASDFYILLHSGILIPLHPDHIAQVEKQMEILETALRDSR